MASEIRNRVDWKKITNEQLVDSLMKIWRFYSQNYDDPWIEHICGVGIRKITLHVGNKFTIKSIGLKNNGDKHHIKEVQQFYDEWMKLARAGGNFTENDAKRWIEDSKILLCSPEEHHIIHSKKFNDFIKNNLQIDILDVYKHFGIIG